MTDEEARYLAAVHAVIVQEFGTAVPLKHPLDTLHAIEEDQPNPPNMWSIGKTITLAINDNDVASSS